MHSPSFLFPLYAKCCDNDRLKCKTSDFAIANAHFTTLHSNVDGWGSKKSGGCADSECSRMATSTL